MGHESKFGQWLDGYGLSKLAADLRTAGVPVSRQAVYQWREGETQPRPRIATKLVELSQRSVTLDDIYQRPRPLVT